MKHILFLDMDGVLVDLPQTKVKVPIGEKREWEDPLFWECLPKTSFADELVRVCSTFYHVQILSTLCTPGSGMGKLLWLRQNYPAIADNVILTTNAKYLLAAPGRVLVDDDPSNCLEFELHGGFAVEVPNPKINLDSRKVTMEMIYNRIRGLHNFQGLNTC